MSDKQPVAKQLAKRLRDKQQTCSLALREKCAGELRRLHEVNTELVGAIAAEREACAKLCEESDRYRGEHFAQLIRSRGQE